MLLERMDADGRAGALKTLCIMRIFA